MNKDKKEANLEKEKVEKKVMKEKKVSKEETLQNEITSLKDQSLRLQADFDNFRKRNASIVSTTREDTTKDVLKDLLTVADNIERAMDTIKDESTKAGIELIMNQIQNIFKKYGVVEIEALGKDFDPNYHNAIMQEDNPDQVGKVTMVFEKGYMINDKVLRYATVRVAK